MQLITIYTIGLNYKTGMVDIQYGFNTETPFGNKQLISTYALEEKSILPQNWSNEDVRLALINLLNYDDNMIRFDTKLIR